MSPYQILSLCLQGLTLLVLYLTLRRLMEYTRETRKLADAAVEEMSRPCVQVFLETDQSDDAMMEGHAASISGRSYVTFQNVGTGPALNFRYGLSSSGMTEGPALSPGQVVSSSIPRNSLPIDSAMVIAEFETLGGAKYRTETVIEDRSWVRRSRFEKIT